MRYATLAILMAVVLPLAGCGDRLEPAAPPDSELSGRTFTATRPAGTTVTVRFTDDGRLVAGGGCNTISGPVDTAGGRLNTSELSITEMACDPERHASDERLLAFLTGGPSWRLDGDTLVLTAGDTELVLTHEKAAPLTGTTWHLDTLIQGEVAGSTPAGVDATLVFGPDQVTVSGLCNLRGVKYSASDTTLTFEPGPTTLMACAPEIMTVEQAVTEVFDGEASYRIDGHTLTITRNGKGVRLTASG
ncbi:META domain-containing protein [Actinophytocola sp.]|uniref:META domain-containing protein n=1 Tax=Actinophytocola sp. TaxID=1872138 RepID=UPI002D7F9C5C|nr:META domain-containing protein [Actinophytocola sp.]HET9143566.1 META domain-containing protein [Actinophytocola sp.]